MPDTPEAVTEKEPYKCWPSQNIHCENSLKLHACLADLKAKGSNEAVLREALEEAGGLISGGVIRRLLGMKARTTEKAEASINAVMDKINAALSAPPIEPVGIRKALRDACSLARGLLLLTKMDGWKNLNKHTDEALLAKCEAALASKDAELAKCANLVAQEARAHGDTKAELAAVVRFVQRVAGDVDGDLLHGGIYNTVSSGRSRDERAAVRNVQMVSIRP